jgi:hypothetical protein
MSGAGSRAFPARLPSALNKLHVEAVRQECEKIA